MKVVGVRFKPAGRIYTFDAGEVECRLDDWLVVETERGMALGQVANPPRESSGPAPKPGLKQVLRMAEERDILRYEQNCELEGYALQFCLERIREKSLPMKLVDVEYLFDASKAIFYFTSEGRVDFRDLVRDLARQFHTRIEMRQIGVRDEAKLVGGVGCCGRELCCATFLTEFAAIGVRMAKDQNVSLNPSKISGICGRLMCCLGYEHSMYKELARKLPKIGKRVETARGEGKVIRRNVLEGTFVVIGPGGETEMTAEQYQRGDVVPAEGPPSAQKPEAGPSQVRSDSRGRGQRRPPPREERAPDRAETRPQADAEAPAPPPPVDQEPQASSPQGQEEAAPRKRRRRRRRKRPADSPGGKPGEDS
ncbi:MAG: regulatory iron-sulfur-containing complex subunit RicT [Deferrisomatales bacterium]|nr:regulatory iron-sulfur-containing complex subunit RicT [Deferrisomatales bacterium]